MSTGELNIRRATSDDVPALAPLFVAYLQFYRTLADASKAERFLSERLERNESTIFIAAIEGVAVGFTQLYPSFSSTAMARIYILNDLFVAPEGRRHGVASALIAEAAQFGRENGAVRLALSTELTNSTAQAVYERLGWKRDTSFCSYELKLV